MQIMPLQNSVSKRQIIDPMANRSTKEETDILPLMWIVITEVHGKWQIRLKIQQAKVQEWEHMI